jgi:hypothetical protein
MRSSLLAIAFAVGMCGAANAQIALGTGTGIGVSRSQAIGVGNAFGAQSLANTISNLNQNSARSNQAQSVNIFNPPSNQGTLAGASNSANSSRSFTTTNSGNTVVKNPGFAPSVYAPSVGGASPCDSYISLGGSAVGGGGSFAFPWQNHNCDMRANALMMKELGMVNVARQRMCFDDDTAAAMASMGFHCLVGKYAPKPVQTAYVAPIAAPLPPTNGDFFYDRRGRKYVSVPCGSPGQVTHAASGECLARR